MTFLNFLIQVNLYLIIFYLFYALLLKNETFFILNRIYLISTAILSLLIPTLQSHWISSLFATQKVGEAANAVILSAEPVIFKPIAEESGLALIDYLGIIYFSGVLIFLIRFIIQLIQVTKPQNLPVKAYSFFNRIVVSEDLPEREAILKHETIHAKQVHSADIIFFELLTILNWFNPIIYRFRNAIKYIHEFIADESTTREINKSEYAMLLLNETLGIQKHYLTNSFFNESLLKRRIHMLNKTKSRKAAILKYGLSAPLFVGMMILSSAVLKAKSLKLEKSVSEIVQTDKEKAQALTKALESIPASQKENIKQQTQAQQQDLTQPSTGIVEKLTHEILEFENTAADTIYEVVNIEVQPEFPGGMEKFYQYVGKSYNLSKEAKDKELQGRIILNFVVEEDGSLTNIKVLRDLGYGTGEEALRVLQASPKWKPALQNGKPVRVSYTIPIVINSGSKQPQTLTVEGPDPKKAFYLLDGKQITYEDSKKLDWSTIESTHVIKEKEKYKEYNAPEDASGVVIIKSKPKQ